MDPLQEYGASAVKRTWYTNNTVGLGGLSLRDMGKIDKWNNVAPVDLTRDVVQWVTSLDEMIAGFRNNPTGDVAFGQALSIGEDLGGAANAILFICNHVTYRQPYNGDNGYLSRYWPNRQRWIDYRAELTELLEGMSK